jgi:hypothetical protein
MRIELELMGVAVFAVNLSLPRLGLFAPGYLPDSIEAAETWTEDD